MKKLKKLLSLAIICLVVLLPFTAGPAGVKNYQSWASPSFSPDPLLSSEEAVIINIEDPESQAIADAYLRARPDAVVVEVKLGKYMQITDYDKVKIAREKIESELSDDIKTLALCFSKPSRVGKGDGTSGSEIAGSINYALTHNWTGNNDLGAAWDPDARVAGFVMSVELVENSVKAHRNGEKGTIYAISASTYNNPRGTLVRNFAEDLSKGNPALPEGFKFEWINNLDKFDQGSYNFLRDKHDVVGQFHGLGIKFQYFESNTVLRGAIADNITSFGGRLEHSHGQETIDIFINAGYIFATGAISEPGGGGGTRRSLNDKFLDPRVALPMWLTGSYAAEVYKASLVNPVRNLGIFCPFVAPYYAVEETDPSAPFTSLTPPPPSSQDPVSSDESSEPASQDPADSEPVSGPDPSQDQKPQPSAGTGSTDKDKPGDKSDGKSAGLDPAILALVIIMPLLAVAVLVFLAVRLRKTKED